MSDYTKTTDFGAKDALASGNANKIVKGSEIDDEFDNIATAIATKYDSNDRGVANGLASLDASVLVPAAQLPAATTTAVGALEIATAAEANARTAADKILVPSLIDGFVDTWAQDAGGMVYDIQQLADPNADQLLGWDDSAGAVVGFTMGTGLAFNGTTIEMSLLGIEDLTDPNADRILFWDDSAGLSTWLTATNGVEISGTNLVLSNVTAGAAQPVNISSGTFTFDLSSITEITMPNFSQSADKIVVSDAGTIKVMPYDESGIKVATVTGTTDTLAAGDMNTFIEYTNASAVTVTLNTGVGTVGNIVVIKQTGAGQVTVSGTATIESAVGNSTRTQDSVITLVCIAANTWALYGDMA